MAEPNYFRITNHDSSHSIQVTISNVGDDYTILYRKQDETEWTSAMG